ncbi:MAG: hypothetical protein U0L20_07175 [Ruminococcus sp.]|nr:hypothetical protein [Ruminococcus sp.]
MKCGNCGFETDTNHCPLCGGMAFDNTENNNNFGFNTESQQTAQQSLQSAPNMQPNLSNENIQESKKRKTKIVPIVISSVLAFVILLVAVINVISNEFGESISNDDTILYQDSLSYLDMYGEPYKVGELANLPSSAVTIKSVTVKDSSESFTPMQNEDDICLSIEVEIINKTSQINSFRRAFTARYIDYATNLDLIFQEIKCDVDPIMAPDSYSDPFYDIESSETRTIEYQFEIPLKLESIFITYSSLGNNCMFEVDIPTKNANSEIDKE